MTIIIERKYEMVKHCGASLEKWLLHLLIVFSRVLVRLVLRRLLVFSRLLIHLLLNRLIRLLLVLVLVRLVLSRLLVVFSRLLIHLLLNRLIRLLLVLVLVRLVLRRFFGRNLLVHRLNRLTRHALLARGLCSWLSHVRCLFGRLGLKRQGTVLGKKHSCRRTPIVAYRALHFSNFVRAQASRQARHLQAKLLRLRTETLEGRFNSD